MLPTVGLSQDTTFDEGKGMRMRSKRFFASAGLSLAACVAATPGSANAAALLTPGTATLYAGSANQTFTVLITGTDQIAGSDLWVQIGDGGTDNGGTTVAPTIVSINMVGGSIFSSDNNNPADNFSTAVDRTPDGLIATDFVNTTGGTTVADAGVLATITMNTTGFALGYQFTVSLGNVGAVATGSDEDSDIFNNSGSLFSVVEPGVSPDPTATITLIGAVPEPASLGLLAVGSLGLIGRRKASR